MGPGEHGPLRLPDGLAALRGAAVAAGIEDDLRARGSSPPAAPSDDPAVAALAAALGLARHSPDSEIKRDDLHRPTIDRPVP